MFKFLLPLLALLAACTPGQVIRYGEATRVQVGAETAHQALCADPHAVAALLDADDLAYVLGDEALVPCPEPEILDVGVHAHLARIRACESGDDYSAVSASGAYRGAYQFSRSTWNYTAANLAGRPDLVGVDPAVAPPPDQDTMALALYAAQGSAPWPVCRYR